MAEQETSQSQPAAPDDASAGAEPKVIDPGVCFSRAQACLAAGDNLEALAELERAHKAAPDDARYRSWLGMLLVNERGLVRRGVELCETALQSDPRPEHFFHLAKVYLRSGEKARAISVLREGMRAHPHNEQLGGALVSLGIRKRPPFRGLERHHPLNKYAGLLLTRLGLR